MSRANGEEEVAPRLVKEPGVTSLLLCRRPLAHDETHDGEDDENDEQHIGDVGRRTSDSSDPQERCDQPNDEKCYGPVQHDHTSLDRNCRDKIRGDIAKTAVDQCTF